MAPLTVAFHSNQLNERGSEVALFDYAFYNQQLLHNRSIVLAQRDNPENVPEIIARFRQHFPVLLYEKFDDLHGFLEDNEVDVLYMIKDGSDDGRVYRPTGRRGYDRPIRTVIHCVFHCFRPHGDIYASIGPWIRGNNGRYPVVPHMIDLPQIPAEDHLRVTLGIPSTATVIGRYGGRTDFNIAYVHSAILKAVKQRPDLYFVFVNTDRLRGDEQGHPRIIYLPKIIDRAAKRRYIHTCDAMIHAQTCGETFGLAIAEFSTCNRPVFTTGTCWPDQCVNGHLHLLGERAQIYHDETSLLTMFIGFDRVAAAQRDWNAYRDYTPAKVMAQFQEVFLKDF